MTSTEGAAPEAPSAAELVEAARQLEVSGLDATRDTSRQVLTVGAALLAIAAGAARGVSGRTTSLERDALGVAAVALGASVAAGAATLFFLTWETTRQIPVTRATRREPERHRSGRPSASNSGASPWQCCSPRWRSSSPLAKRSTAEVCLHPLGQGQTAEWPGADIEVVGIEHRAELLFCDLPPLGRRGSASPGP